MGARRRGPKRKRAFTRLLVVLGLIAVSVVVFTKISSAPPRLFKGQPSELAILNAQLHGLPQARVRIVELAESQIGYRTNPVHSYCNKFSAYWVSGQSDCPAGELDEEWCADFAAWTWAKAGIPLTYQYINGDLNSSSASFYEWGVRKGTWHPVGSGYVPLPGDVAVYGLNIPTLYASHVAVVVGTSGPHHAPDAVNGDANGKSYSDVEFVTNEIHPDAGNNRVALSGYVSPLP